MQSCQYFEFADCYKRLLPKIPLFASITLKDYLKIFWPHYFQSNISFKHWCLQWYTKLFLRKIVLLNFQANPANISISGQSCINILINFKTTWIWLWKRRKIQRWIFHVAQRYYNVSVWRWGNVETILWVVDNITFCFLFCFYGGCYCSSVKSITHILQWWNLSQLYLT